MLGPASTYRVEQENVAENSQHRRLHLRSASHGYAPAPAASDSTGYEEHRERLKLEVQGDLRLPP